MQLTWTLDTIALFGSTPADINLLDQLLCGRAASVADLPNPADLVLGIPYDSFAADLDKPVAAAFGRCLECLAQNGVRLVPLEMAEVLRLDRTAAFPIAIFEAAVLWQRALAQRGIAPSRFVERIASPDVRAIFTQILGDAVSIEDYAVAMNEALMPMRHIYSAIFAAVGIDGIAFPTVAVPPPLLGVNDSIMVNGEERPLFPAVVRNTSPGALAGLPGISLPFGTMDNGLPFGLEIDGPAGADSRLLAIAQSLAQLAPHRKEEH